jgi:hypothetical protein
VTDVLVDDARGRSRSLALVGGAVLVALVAGAAALRSTLPPPELELRLDGVTGTALQGESFVRLNLALEQSGVRELEEAVLTVAGTTERGQRPTTLHDGRMTVQIDVSPPCAALLQDLAPGVLDLRLHDASGDVRQVAVDVPADEQLVRLLRYRCT